MKTASPSGVKKQSPNISSRFSVAGVPRVIIGFGLLVPFALMLGLVGPWNVGCCMLAIRCCWGAMLLMVGIVLLLLLLLLAMGLLAMMGLLVELMMVLLLLFLFSSLMVESLVEGMVMEGGGAPLAVLTGLLVVLFILVVGGVGVVGVVKYQC